MKWMDIRSMACMSALCVSTFTSAEHIIGGELYYDHLGNDQYQITLTLYRDCYSVGAPFDEFGRISVYTGAGGFLEQFSIPYPGSTFVPVVLESPCLTLPPDLCVETTSYITVVTLPPSPDGYHLTYQRCCRQPSVLNIMNPSIVGLTATIHIPPEGLHENSSARFNDLPPIALCLNEPLIFDHSASDPDGDELVYSLTTPYNGADEFDPYPLDYQPPPYVPIPWADGYSETHQIDSDPELAIDPVTGLLTVQPGLIGNFVIGVSVKEYRNGELLSETIRDFLFSVVPCEANITAIIEPQTEFCTDDLTVTFGNNSLGGYQYAWDFGDPASETDTSSASEPTWTYGDHGTYTITLILSPGAVCADTTEVTYELYPQPEPFFLPDTSCGELQTVLIAEGSFGEEADIVWDLGPGATPTNATGGEIAVTFSEIGEHPVQLTVTENGCVGVYEASIFVHPIPTALFYADPASPQLVGTDVLFTDGSSGNGMDITDWVWMIGEDQVAGNGNSFFWQQPTPGTYEITLTVTNEGGCSDTVTIIYEIIPGEIDIPNVFTPNGDGSNEAFVIENVQYYPNELKIYNRWGIELYETRNYQNQWRALDIPDGTYYYILRMEDGREFTGHLTVLR